MKRIFSIVTIVVLCSCVSQRVAPSTEESIEHAADAPGASAAEIARGGWSAYLQRGDAKAAQRRFEAALDGDPLERWALFGMAEMAADRVDDLAAVRFDGRLVSAHPEDPLAELAFSRFDAWQGASPAVDAEIKQAVMHYLGSGRASARGARRAHQVLAHVAAQRGDDVVERQEWAALGAVTSWSIAGPFAAHHLLDLDAPTPLDDATTPIAASYITQFGLAPTRRLAFPDGDVGLDEEPFDADLYVAASDVTLARGGDYLLFVEGAGALRLFIDGERTVVRTPYPRLPPRLVAVPVSLAPGRHRVLVRWTRAEGARFRVALTRRDGSDSDAQTEPAKGTMRAAPHAAASAESPPPFSEDESTEAFLAALAAFPDDRAAAREQIERVVALAPQSAPALALRAELTLRDADLPERVAKGRAARDEDAALAADKSMVRLQLHRAAMDRDAEHYDDAETRLALAAAAAPGASRVLIAQARLRQARGDTTDARRLAGEALAGDPDRCDAFQLLDDLAHREEDTASEDALAPQLVKACPDGRRTSLLRLRERGDVAGALQLARSLAAKAPARVAPQLALADAFLASGDAVASAALLRSVVELAPRSAMLHHRLANALELAGDKTAAEAERDASLRLSGGDLLLRHALDHEHGQTPLAWAHRDAKEAIASFRAAGGAARGAPAELLLDQAALEVNADGSAIERIHTLTQILDRRGLAHFGDVNVPDGAEIVALRTLKPDGSVLEPDEIAGKDSISLSGLEPGDYVDFEYLRAMGARDSALPGFASASFTFRAPEIPIFESSYEVHAAPAAGLTIDAHHFSAPPIEHVAAAVGTDGYDRWTYTARKVPALVPEPSATSEAEFMPWVQVGSGAGQAALAQSFADFALLRTRPAFEIDQLERSAPGSTPREKAAAIYAAIAKVVRGRGRSTDFSASAAQVLASGRGNRLPVLKAALTAAGIHSHVALIRAFGTDPAPYRFTHGDLWTAAVLRVDFPDGPLWIDSSMRMAPFGALPSSLSDAEATILPEPGESVRVERTPKSTDEEEPALLATGVARRRGAMEEEPALLATGVARRRGAMEEEPALLATGVARRRGAMESARAIVFDLQLEPDGTLTGSAVDTSTGFQGAGMAEALEQLEAAKRKQALESQLTHNFHGAVLDDLSVEEPAAPGDPAVLRYHFHAKGFARRTESGRLSIPASFWPLRLGHRFVGRAERVTPLLIDSAEQLRIDVRLALPAGTQIVAPPATTSSLPFAAFSWSSSAAPGSLTLHERLDLGAARVGPDAWNAFKDFASAVDAAQSAEIVLEPKAL